MKFPRRFPLLACTCLVWSLTAHSGEAPETDLKTTAVAAFKNGLAFVVKQGDVRLENGVGNLSPVPNATLGSLWIAPNDAGTSLDEVVAHHHKVSAQQSLTALAEVLLANAGKAVTVIDNNQKEYTGEIVGFRQTEKLSGPPTPPNRSDQNFYPIPAPPPQPAMPEYLLLKSEGKLLALYFHNIARVILPENPILDRPQEED
ncbi:MAG: hypothetical protein WCC99_05470, partial [Candidatus Sulfotelmatobacter sp.]